MQQSNMITFWCEKYRPETTKNVIGNKMQMKNISCWLDSYVKNREAHIAIPKRKKKVLIKIPVDAIDSDESDFEIDMVNSSDDDDSDKKDDKTNTNVKPIATAPTTKQQKHDDDDHSCLFVLGDHGIGKTCSVLSVLKDKNYDIQMVALSKIGQMKNSQEYVEKLIKGSHIYNHMVGKSTHKKVIVVDEIESATSPIEKKFIFSLLKLNEKHWYMPIIFISSNKHNKVISTLKLNSISVYFQQPTDEQMKSLLLNICVSENICLENEEVANKIIQHAQKDFRKLVFTLQDLHSNYSSDISNDDIDDYCTYSKKKDNDLDIYKAVSKMITHYQGMEECIRIYESEKTIIPLSIHQNFIKYLTRFYGNKTKGINLACEIAESLSKGDLIENYIFCNQNWDMNEVHGFFTCILPSYELATSVPNMLEGDARLMIDFPHDLYKTSIKKINKKNKNNSNICLKNFDIDDFICANKLMNKLIEENKIDECAKLMKQYNSKVENLELILKIDKMNGTQPAMQSSVKKQFSKILGSSKRKPK